MLKKFKLNQTEELKDYFNEFGFVIIEKAFTKQACEEFKSELSELIRAYLVKAGLDDNYTGDDIFHKAVEDLENLNHIYVASLYDSIYQCPSFMRIVASDNLTKGVRNLLPAKNAPLYGHTNRCRIDPPQDDRRTYGWHQEVFYTIPRGRYIQSWAPLLNGSRKENGTIEIAIGSHVEGIARQSWNEAEGRATQIIVDQEIIDKYETMHIEIDVGDLLLFSGYLSHRSGANVSKQHRYSLVGMFHDVSKLEFMPPKLNFEFSGETPREYFDMHMRNKGLLKGLLK